MATAVLPSNPVVPLTNTLSSSNVDSSVNADSRIDAKKPNTFDTNPDFSTTRWSYLKLYVLASLMRTSIAVGNRIAIWTGYAQRPMPPHDYFFVPSSKGNGSGKGRSIRVNVYRNEAARKNVDRPSAVHFNWHGKFDFIFIIYSSPVTALFLSDFYQFPVGVTYTDGYSHPYRFWMDSTELGSRRRLHPIPTGEHPLLRLPVDDPRLRLRQST